MPIEVRDEHYKTDMNTNERDSDVLCLRLPPKLEINNLSGLLKTIFSGNSIRRFRSPGLGTVFFSEQSLKNKQQT